VGMCPLRVRRNDARTITCARARARVCARLLSCHVHSAHGDLACPKFLACLVKSAILVARSLRSLDVIIVCPRQNCVTVALLGEAEGRREGTRDYGSSGVSF